MEGYARDTEHASEEGLRRRGPVEGRRGDLRVAFAPTGDVLPLTPDAAGVPALPEVRILGDDR